LEIADYQLPMPDHLEDAPNVAHRQSTPQDARPRPSATSQVILT
jgi:hypothetical protein